ncbi:MAG: Vacuolar protein sorting-associated protein 62 [Vezdaea aestivalis]|nr:MAG: Vacuolar protein sorting-associated protein 62 [Vezdaea aestivalis]
MIELRRVMLVGHVLLLSALSFGWTEAANASNSYDIPDYVLEYAPLVHLFSGEQFWPCDIQDHLLHVTPHLNYTPLQAEAIHPTLQNLDRLNQWDGGWFVYLHSNDNVEERPAWLAGEKNIPVFKPGSAQKPIGRYQMPLKDQKSPPQVQGGRSDAPAVLLVVDKGQGIVDAFWFFFYSYNLGPVVLGVRFGNHVGDWEHSMIRFKDGKPVSVFLSEHSGGEAYTYEAVEKIGKRARTHAMYATPGIHAFVLPLGLLHDQTDRGPLWDPTLNSHTYIYDFLDDELHASSHTPSAPTNWFYFKGRWGDRSYPLTDSRQYEFVGQYHYVSGPLGPRFKRLYRRTVCQSPGYCDIRNKLDPDIIRVWPGVSKEDDGQPGWKETYVDDDLDS